MSADDTVRLAAVTEGLDADLLLGVAAHDPSRDVRRAALKVLAEGLDEDDGVGASSSMTTLSSPSTRPGL